MANEAASATGAQAASCGLPDIAASQPIESPALREALRSLSELLGRCNRLSVITLDLAPYRMHGAGAGHNSEAVYEAIAAVVRKETTQLGGCVAELSPERYIVMLPGADAQSAGDWVTLLATRWPHALNAPPSPSLVIETAAGISASPEHGRDANTLLRRSRIALRRAQRQHSVSAIYSAGMEERQDRERILRSELRQAMTRGELQLMYQPQLTLADRTVRGFEALLRWRHPVLGEIAPEEFIPLAEESGEIGQLSRWVLDKGVAQLAEWRAQRWDLSLSINLSPRDVAQERLESMVCEPLARYGVPGRCLTLELTEHAVLGDLPRAAETLRSVARNGVRWALDDFGTGHASLELLRDLPLNELKVDRSFAAELQNGSRNSLIVGSAVKLAHALRLQVVVEGVETAASLVAAARLGCERAQGFLIGRPTAAVSALRFATRPNYAQTGASAMRIAQPAGPAPSATRPSMVSRRGIVADDDRPASLGMRFDDTVEAY